MSALGPLSLAWCDGPVRFFGTGEALVHAGPSAAAVLAEASCARVDVSGPALVPPAPWFSGFAFDGASAKDAWWEGFPAARAFVPKLLVAQGPAGASLTAYEAVRMDGEIVARARAEAALQAALEQPAPARAGRSDVAYGLREDPAAWGALVERALDALASGMLRKVVLARAVDVTAEAPFDVGRALEAGPGRRRCGSGVAVRWTGRSSWAPRRSVWCACRGATSGTQALAGSAGPEEGAALSESPKEVREHGAVVEDVRVALDAVAEQLEVAAVTQVSLGYVTHLDTRITGTMAPRRDAGRGRPGAAPHGGGERGPAGLGPAPFCGPMNGWPGAGMPAPSGG